MKPLCESIVDSTSGMWTCKETANGARIRTTCVYPSFEPVFVYVAKLGNGFVVHDAGETVAVILAHGVEGKTAKRAIRAECRRYDVAFEERRISLKVETQEWIETAIIAVANTAAAAARSALQEKRSAAEHDLADVIFEILEPKLERGTVTRRFPFCGGSGRQYKFDLAVQRKGKLTLIETVAPHASSVNAKFVAFADVPTDSQIQKIAAHNNDLSQEDILLFQTVADVASPDGVIELIAGNSGIH